MKLFKTYITSFVCFTFSFSLFAVEANLWRYKVNPGHLSEALELFDEALDIADELGTSTVIAQQTQGRNGEFIFHWVDFYNSPEDRAKNPYDNEIYEKYTDKFYSSDAISTVWSYTMTLIDDQLCSNPGIVSVYVWKPNPGMMSETLSLFKASKSLFEKHGFEIDMWQEGVGGNDNLQFVMCSSSAEERAKSIMSLNNDPAWKTQQPNSPVWDSYNEFSELMYSFELTPIRKFTPQQ